MMGTVAVSRVDRHRAAATVAWCFLAATCVWTSGARGQAPPVVQTSAEPSGPSVETLIARHLAARGGHDVLAAVRSVRMQGTVELHGGFEMLSAPLTLQLLPQEHKARLETTLGGKRAVTIYDGKRGWRQEAGGPFVELQGESLSTIARTAEFAGLLFDPAAHGRTVETLGMTTVRGAPAFSLRVEDPALGAWKVLLAVDTALEIAELCLGADGRTTTQTQLMDFRKVDGVVIPYSVESATLTTNPGGTAAIWTVAIWDKVELGVALATADFEGPTAR